MSTNLNAWSRQFMVTASLFTIAVLAGCSDDPDTEPAAALEEFAAAYNANDLDALMMLFSDESVIIRHPFEPSPAEGLIEIRALLVQDRADAASKNPYEVMPVETGSAQDTVTFNHTWRAENGQCFAGTGHTMTVEANIITRWEWGTFGLPCDET